MLKKKVVLSLAEQRRELMSDLIAARKAEAARARYVSAMSANSASSLKPRELPSKPR